MKIFSKLSKPTFPGNVKKPQIIQVELIKKEKYLVLVIVICHMAV